MFLVLTVINGQERPIFTSPVGGEMRLSGTFGELRSNHFHTGIDIKSKNGRGGDAILAAADGYIERIRISAVGYGRALYIAHPNGYSTVYAHLDRFHPDIETRIRVFQKKHHSAHFDLYPLDESWCVALGDTIAFMGNSGSSAGPHLHFEVRHTESEAPINPLHWQFPYQNGSKPYARQLKLYRLDTLGVVVSVKTVPLQNHMGHFKPKAESISVPPGRYGWAVQAVHPFNQWRNQNGLYSIENYIDSTLTYAVCMDSLPFHLNRYINAHIDYPLYCTGRRQNHTLFARPHQKAACLRFDDDRGIWEVQDSSLHKVKIILSDIEGTTAHVDFQLSGLEAGESASTNKLTEEMGSPFEVFEYEDQHITFRAPAHTFYSAHPIRISSQCEVEGNKNLPTVEIETDCHPFHQSAELRFTSLGAWPDSLRQKLFLGFYEDGAWVDKGGYWSGDEFVGQVRKEGQYRLSFPGLAPEIKISSTALRPGRNFTFRIRPHTKSSFRIKDIQIRITHDGQFIPFLYDKKYQRVQLRIPEDWKEDDLLIIRIADRWGQVRKYQLPMI